jgi:hypothetical protein
MGHSAGDHLEHAEHAKHAAHSGFDTTVTMTIAIVAAVLAGVTMLGHRAHNETLVYQGNALVAQTESAIYHNQANDNWAWYQALKIRGNMDETALEISDVAALKPGEEAAKKLKSNREKWAKNAKKHASKGEELQKKAEGFEEKGKVKIGEAKGDLAMSHAIHQKAMRFDYGELALQLGVVLCSLAILLKSRSFWLTGIVCAIVGLSIATTGHLNLFMDSHHDATHEEHQSGETEKAKTKTPENHPSHGKAE